MHWHRYTLLLSGLIFAGLGTWLPAARSTGLPTVPGAASAPPMSTAALGGSAQASPNLEASIKAGAARVRLYGCAVCHGYRGNSTNPEFPNLAGQDAMYLAAQLENFKSGARENQLMRGMASALSSADVRDVAVFFAHQRPIMEPAGRRDKSDVASTALFNSGDARRGVPACAECHGIDGAGRASVAPRLAGQQVDYLRTTLTAWHEGATWGTSDQARIMPGIASKLTPAEIDHLAVYIRNLSVPNAAHR